MEDSQKNKNASNLGEGIKPEEVVYSSRDILGNTVAGEEKDPFTRIKQDSSIKKKFFDKTRQAQPTHRSRLQPLLQNRTLLIIIIASIVVIVAVIIAAIILSNSSDKSAEEHIVNESATSEEASENDLLTEDGIYPNTDEYGFAIEDLPEDITNLSPNTGEDGELTPADYMTQELAYIGKMIEGKYFLAAGHEIESLLFQLDNYPDDYDNCQKAKAYEVIDDFYQARGDTSEEDIKANSDILNNYKGLCDEV